MSRLEVDDDRAVTRHYAQADDLEAGVDELARPIINRKTTPGLVVGVLLPDGSKRFFGYGMTQRINGHRPDGETLFAIGSLSKGFLGATTAILVQEGKLSWDDTLERLLPAGTPLSADARTITLLQLAMHTSGLPRQPLTLRTLAYFIQYLFTGENFYRHFDRTYLVKYLADFEKPATSAPRYSNIGYGLLDYVVELRSGEQVDALVTEKLLLPLKLTATGYAPQQLPGYAARARGHAGDQPKFIRRGQPVPDWQFDDVMMGAAAMYSNAHDLLLYASAHLNGTDDRLLHLGLQDTLDVRFDRPERAAAIAWVVDDVDGCAITYQTGFIAGYSSYLGMDVANKTAVVVLQNSFNWTNSIGHRLLLRIALAK